MKRILALIAALFLVLSFGGLQTNAFGDGGSAVWAANMADDTARYLPFDSGNWYLEKDVWGDIGNANVLALLQSIRDVYFDTYGREYVLLRKEPLFVGNDMNGTNPFIYRDMSGIMLHTRDNYWCQYMYQFGHELYHYIASVPAGVSPGEGRHLWFEESLAEMHSLHVLDVLAETWKDSSNANWRSFAPSIREYYNDCVAYDSIGVSGRELVKLWTADRTRLENNAYYGDRKIINAFSPILYEEVFKKDKYAWDALKALISLGPCENLTFEEYLNKWYNSCNDKEKASVSKIAGIFEVTVTDVKENSLTNFQKVRAYSAGVFTDIQGWYFDYVRMAYEYGIINGVGNNAFNPNGTLKVEEAITIAARIHAVYKYSAIFADEKVEKYKKNNEPWYAMYLSYAKAEGLIGNEFDALIGNEITRAQTIHCWSKILLAKDLAQSMIVTAIPDVNNYTAYKDDIFMMYRAGIVSGVDEKGTFLPDKSLTRAECSALFMRLMDESMRSGGAGAWNDRADMRKCA